MRTFIILLIGTAFIALICVCGDTDAKFSPQKAKMGSSYLYE